MTFKNYLVIGLLLSIAFLGCKKNSSNSSSGDVITYEVKVQSGSIYSISYLDETASGTNITNFASSKWSISFTNKAGKPRTLLVSGISNATISPAPSITANIYVNGNLIKTATDNITTGNVLLQYNLLP